MKKKEQEKKVVDFDEELDGILGKGSAAVDDGFEAAGQREIEIDRIIIPEDVFRDDPEDDIESLAASIKDHGLLQPIVVSKDLTLIAGHRRLQAHKKLGRSTIKASIVEMDADKQSCAMGAENIHRKDWEPEEEAKYYEKLLLDKHFPTQKALAKALRIREARVSERLKFIGKGKEYPAVKAKKKARAESEREVKERTHRINEKTLPSGVTAVFTKTEVNIAFKLKIEDAGRVKSFDVKKEVIARLEEITTKEFKDFSEEMDICLNRV